MMMNNIMIGLGMLCILLGLILIFSLQFNLMQAIEINEYRGLEKVYRMQIEHYNPKDYLLQLKEIRPN